MNNTFSLIAVFAITVILPVLAIIYYTLYKHHKEIAKKESESKNIIEADDYYNERYEPTWIQIAESDLEGVEDGLEGVEDGLDSMLDEFGDDDLLVDTDILVDVDLDDMTI